MFSHETVAFRLLKKRVPPVPLPRACLPSHLQLWRVNKYQFRTWHEMFNRVKALVSILHTPPLSLESSTAKSPQSFFVADMMPFVSRIGKFSFQSWLQHIDCIYYTQYEFPCPSNRVHQWNVHAGTSRPLWICIKKQVLICRCHRQLTFQEQGSSDSRTSSCHVLQ